MPEASVPSTWRRVQAAVHSGFARRRIRKTWPAPRAELRLPNPARAPCSPRSSPGRTLERVLRGVRRARSRARGRRARPADPVVSALVVAGSRALALAWQHAAANRDEPPVVWSWLPFLGSAVAFGRDPLCFVRRARARAHGPAASRPSRARRSSWAARWPAIFREKARLRFDSISRDVVQSAFAMPRREAADLSTARTSTRSSRSARRCSSRGRTSTRSPRARAPRSCGTSAARSAAPTTRPPRLRRARAALFRATMARSSARAPRAPTRARTTTSSRSTATSRTSSAARRPRDLPAAAAARDRLGARFDARRTRRPPRPTPTTTRRSRG